MHSVTRSRTHAVRSGGISTRRATTHRILALSVVVALVFSLGAAPFAAAGSTPDTGTGRRGVDLGALATGTSAAASGPMAVTRGELRRPAGSVATASPVDAAATEKLFAYGFETWPGPLALWSETNTGWGRSSYRKTEGTYSAYCAGSRITAPGPYANGMNTWMVLGPFDLSQYDMATLTLDLNFKTGMESDHIAVGVSTDDDLYRTIELWGDSGGWWIDAFSYLEDFYGDGTVDVTGKSKVWIAFIFQSDETIVDEGAYVDNVRLSAGLQTIEPPLPVTFVAGDTRFDTAVQASKLAYPDGTGTVIIATGRNWPDALGGSALAGVLDAPILLTERDSLPPQVLAEIRSLEATHAVILGGPAAVGVAVENALKAEFGSQDAVERIAGNNRYETADKIARRVIAEQGDAYDGTAFVATGGNFPDALAAAPPAAAKGWPLYLSNPASGISSGTRAAMAGVTDVIILGGETAVRSWVETSLGTWGFNCSRISGTTRYATAARVAYVGITQWELSPDGIGIATGENYPDALAGGVLQGKAHSVMLLTLSLQLSPEARQALVDWRPYINKMTIFGGLSAVSQRTLNAIYRTLDDG